MLANRKVLRTRSACAMAGENVTRGRPARRTSSALTIASALERAAAGGDDVLDEPGDEPTHQFVGGAVAIEPRMPARNLGQDVGEEGHDRQVFEREEAGAQAVVNVMRVVGDVVGDGCGLRLGAGMAGEIEILLALIIQDGAGNATLAVFSDRRAVRQDQRPVVLDQALQRFPRQVQSVEAGIAPLQSRDEAQRLRVVVEAPIGPHRRVRARPRRYARTGYGRGHGPGTAPRRGPRRAPASGRASARSEPPRSNGSAGCDNDRPHERRRPASCA